MNEWRSTVVPAADGRRIRIAQTGPESPAAELLVLPGRGDLTSKYTTIAAAAAQRGVRTTVVNWRGQGGSERLEVPRGALHVDDVAEYLLDVDVMLESVSPSAPRLVLAHSMGGLMALTAIAAGRLHADRAVVISPMLRFRMPLPEWVTAAVASVAVAQGRSRAWATGERWIDPVDCTLETNMAVDDAVAFEALQVLRRSEPDDVVTGSTWGWTAAVVRGMAAFRHQDLAQLAVPLTIVSSRDDRSVDAAEHRRLVRRWPGAELIEASGRHDLLIEGGGTGAAVQRMIAAELALVS